MITTNYNLFKKSCGYIEIFIKNNEFPTLTSLPSQLINRLDSEIFIYVYLSC